MVALSDEYAELTKRIECYNAPITIYGWHHDDLEALLTLMIDDRSTYPAVFKLLNKFKALPSTKSLWDIEQQVRGTIHELGDNISFVAAGNAPSSPGARLEKRGLSRRPMSPLAEVD